MQAGSTAAHLPLTRPPRPEPGPLNTGELTQQERLSRQQAAERLIDLAYTLAAGGPLEISLEGRLFRLPVAGELRLERALQADRERVELRMVLTWSAPEP